MRTGRMPMAYKALAYTTLNFGTCLDNLCETIGYPNMNKHTFCIAGFFSAASCLYKCRCTASLSEQ
ncbi:hypothetical protein LguiB_009249 [Lonicera macranthoides]